MAAWQFAAARQSPASARRYSRCMAPSGTGGPVRAVLTSEASVAQACRMGTYILSPADCMAVPVSDSTFASAVPPAPAAQRRTW